MAFQTPTLALAISLALLSTTCICPITGLPTLRHHQPSASRPDTPRHPRCSPANHFSSPRRHPAASRHATNPSPKDQNFVIFRPSERPRSAPLRSTAARLHPGHLVPSLVEPRAKPGYSSNQLARRTSSFCCKFSKTLSSSRGSTPALRPRFSFAAAHGCGGAPEEANARKGWGGDTAGSPRGGPRPRHRGDRSSSPWPSAPTAARPSTSTPSSPPPAASTASPAPRSSLR